MPTLGDARSGKLADNIAGFGRALRRAGLRVDSSRIALAEEKNIFFRAILTPSTVANGSRLVNRATACAPAASGSTARCGNRSTGGRRRDDARDSGAGLDSR